MGDAPALAVEPLDRAPDRAVRRAPAEDQQVAAVRPEDLQRRDVVGDPGDLRLAQELHPVVVVRVVADVAGDVGLLEAADPVLEAGRSRDRPLRASVFGSRSYGWNVSCSVQFATEMSGRSVDATGSATARRRSRGTRPTGRRPASRTSGRAARPRSRDRSTRRASPARRSAAASRCSARTSPGAGRPARSSSASRSTGRPAGRR